MLDKQGRTPEEAAKYWHDAFWDMMFKKYCNLPIGTKILQNEGKFSSFKDWWEAQLSIMKATLAGKDNKIKQLKKELSMKNKKNQEVKETVEDNTNIVPFEQVKARMGGKIPPTNNWLGDLQKGTRFLVYMKNNYSSLLGDFILGTDPKMMKAVYLGCEGPMSYIWKWHDPIKFSQEFGLYDILEVQDGNDTEVQEGRVEGDGKS